jgi:hypothetical protein
MSTKNTQRQLLSAIAKRASVRQGQQKAPKNKKPQKQNPRYQQAPTAVGLAGMIASPARVVSSPIHPKYGVATRLQGCDLIGGVKVPSASNQFGTILANFYISPTSFLGTRQAQLAPLWERYKYNSIRFHYVPAAGTTYAGQVVAMCDYDVDDNLSSVPSAQRPQQVSAHYGSTACAIWQTMSTELNYVDNMSDWYTDDEAVDNADLRLQNQGQYWLVLLDQVLDPTGNPIQSDMDIGTLYVEYDLEFYIPQLDNNQNPLAQEAWYYKAGAFANTASESDSAFAGFCSAMSVADTGAALNPLRVNDLSSKVVFTDGSTYGAVSVSYEGTIDWTFICDSNGDFPEDANVGSTGQLMLANGVNIIVGQLDPSSIGTGFTYPLDAPFAFATTSPSQTFPTGPFYPVMQPTTTLASPSGGTAVLRFRTVSVNGETVLRFPFDTNDRTVVVWPTVIMGIQIASNSGASPTPTLFELAQRKHRISRSLQLKDRKLLLSEKSRGLLGLDTERKEPRPLRVNPNVRKYDGDEKEYVQLENISSLVSPAPLPSAGSSAAVSAPSLGQTHRPPPVMVPSGTLQIPGLPPRRP